MKKLFFISMSIFMTITISGIAQEWVTNGNNINNNNSGNVGIGTSSPISKLNVFEGEIRISATTTNRSLVLDALSTVNLATMIALKRSDSHRWLFGANGENGVDDFVFARYSNAGTFLGGVVTFQRTTGNALFQNKVGIGTTNPGSFMLAVEGKIGAREVQVTLTNPWPDYVFESTYELPTLTEVEKFIKSNKHLPGIPSKREIEENGHKLGEMDMLLLKKVEELTLYMIDLKKENEELKKQMVELRKL